MTILNSQAMVPATVTDLSGRGMRMAIPIPLDLDTALAIETADGLYLGEVMYCQPDHDQWAVGVRVAQCLHYTPDLERLRRSLLEYHNVEAPGNADVTMEIPHGARDSRS